MYGLNIIGLGVEYPPFRVGPGALETLARRYYPSSPALEQTLAINRRTTIDTRAAVGTVDHPLFNGESAPSISELNDFFMEEGVRLAVEACRKAMNEAGIGPEDVTHMVSTSCTTSANPGFDHFVAVNLGLSQSLEKILLHGVGCSGGLAAIRTAANLAQGASFCRRPGRVLVVACEISSVFVRSELDSIAEEEQIRIGPCLFSDCASACVLSNSIQDLPPPIFEIQNWLHRVISDSVQDLRFDVSSKGWKAVLSKRVPQLAVDSVKPAFDTLVKSLGHEDGCKPKEPRDFDWALHPGGATIIDKLARAFDLEESHVQAAIDIYTQYGNSSSATIMSVLDRLRRSEGQENVIACAFGPGINLELMAIKRV